MSSPPPERIASMIPPQERIFVGGGDFLEVGTHYLNLFKKFGLKPHHRVLDIGCGIGRMAVPMTQYLDAAGRYDGFDIREDGVQWCRERISTQYPSFRFEHTPLRNSMYLPDSAQDASGFRFPYPSGSFDFAIATSVFTHLQEPVVCRYLDEINRVLKPRGRIAATFFLFAQDSRPHATREENGLHFPHHCGHYRVQLQDNPDAAIAYQESWVTAQFERRGLQVRWPISYEFQDVIVAEKHRPLLLRQRWRELRRRWGLRA
jgi:SAM-dependent methyltransferase